jgi:DNA repair exonuclease SbcCD ATPase subunit
MPRHVNTSLKAADRIPGLRPKVEKPRGAPPPWADWVHKFGPLVTAIVSAVIFFATLHYTIEPVYRRAILEEANAKLEIESKKAVAELGRVNSLVAQSSDELNKKTEQVRRLSAQISDQDRKVASASAMSAATALELGKAQSMLNDTKNNLAEKVGQLDSATVSLKEVERALTEVIANATAGWYDAAWPPCFGNRLRVNVGDSTNPDDYKLQGCVAATLTANVTLLARLPSSTQQRFQRIAESIDLASAPKLQQLAVAAAAAAREYAQLKQQHLREREARPSSGNLQRDLEAVGPLLQSHWRREGEIKEKQRKELDAIDKVVESDHKLFLAEVKKFVP